MARRVAYLVEFPTLSGGERSLLALLEALDRTRFDPFVLGPTEGPLARALAEIEVPVLADPRDETACGAILKGAGADILHANSLAMGCRAGPLSCSTGIPALSHVRDIMRLGGTRKAALADNQVIVAVSRAVREALVVQGLSSGRIHVVHNGIDAEQFPSRKLASARLRAELGLESSCPLVGCVGQICLRKGQDVFLKAAARVAAVHDRAHFVVVGARFSQKDESIGFERSLHDAASRPPLRDRVHFLGWRDDVPSVMAGLNVLAHASHQEPFGRVLLEALAAGTPIAATDVGGTAEMIDAGKTGLLVPQGDAAGLAEAISDLLNPGLLANRLSVAGTDCVRASFTVKKMTTAVQRLYDALAGPQKSP